MAAYLLGDVPKDVLHEAGKLGGVIHAEESV
jgi:hypothetical protein